MATGETYNTVLIGSGDVKTGEGGSTIREILRCSALGLIAARIDVVICNNSERRVPGFYQKIADHNQEFGAHVRVETINSFRQPAAEGEDVEDGAQTLAEAQACVDVITEARADIFVLAGYMKKAAGALLGLDGINSHPGPVETPGGIPGVDTKGLHGVDVQEAVLRQGYPYSAHTVHRVTAEYDSGDVIAWRPVLVKPGDTAQRLFERVQIVEKACLPFDIEAYAQGRLSA